VVRLPREKASPLINVIDKGYRGEVFGGEEFRIMKWASLSDKDPVETIKVGTKEFVAPLIASGVADSYEIDGTAAATVSFILNEIGIGSNTFKKKKSKHRLGK